MSEPTPANPENQPQPLGQIQPQRVRIRMPQRKPVLTYVLLAVTVAVYALQYLSAAGVLNLGNCPYFFTPDIPACYGMKVNQLIEAGQWWRFITPIVLHASLLHIGFNMYALNALGPELERMFGHGTFLALYLLSGFAGVVMSFVLSSAPSLGASTAIFGLLGAHAVFAYRNQHVFGRRAQQALRGILQIALINLLIGLSPGIDNWGHLGGFLGGLLFSSLGAPVYKIHEELEEFRLENTTAPSQVWLGALAVLLIFGAAAAGKLV